MSDGTQTTEGVWPEPAGPLGRADHRLGAPPRFGHIGVSGLRTATNLPPAPRAPDGGRRRGRVARPRSRRRASGSGSPLRSSLAVVLVALGFWGGAIAQKNHATASAGNGAAAFAARLRNAASGATGATGTTGAGAGGFQFPAAPGARAVRMPPPERSPSSTATPLYILTATNQLVKVTLTPSTTVTRNAKAKTVQLRPGDTVVVQGATGEGRRRPGVLRRGDRQRGQLDGAEASAAEGSAAAASHHGEWRQRRTQEHQAAEPSGTPCNRQRK